jgi:hypothetical protein
MKYIIRVLILTIVILIAFAVKYIQAGTCVTAPAHCRFRTFFVRKRSAAHQIKRIMITFM